MTYEQWLDFATKKIELKGSPSARLDAILILENTISQDRIYIFARPHENLNADQQYKLNCLLNRRLNGEPMAYIIGSKWFYGREFMVTADVLIPRPDSETIIELLLYNSKYYKDNTPTIIDVGTGSGCLAITAKLELPEAQITACDISNKALEVAKKNAQKFNANIKFVQSDLFSIIDKKFDITLANLPYVPKNFDISPDVKYEPNTALYAGNDGLDTIKEFFAQMPTKVNPNGIVILEALAQQHKIIEQLASNRGFELIEVNKLIQVYKYCG